MTAREALPPADEVRLARYRAGSMSADERRAFERDALASDALVEALYREVSLDAVGAPIRRQSRKRRLIRSTLPLAATLALVIVGVEWQRGHQGPAEDPVRGGSNAVQLREPLGELGASPERFEWTADPGARSYRLELFGADGSLLRSVTTDGTVLPRTGVSAEPLSAGEWRVVALDADGLERSATPRAAFQVRAP